MRERGLNFLTTPPIGREKAVPEIRATIYDQSQLFALTKEVCGLMGVPISHYGDTRDGSFGGARGELRMELMPSLPTSDEHYLALTDTGIVRVHGVEGARGPLEYSLMQWDTVLDKKDSDIPRQMTDDGYPSTGEEKQDGTKVYSALSWVRRRTEQMCEVTLNKETGSVRLMMAEEKWGVSKAVIEGQRIVGLEFQPVIEETENSYNHGVIRFVVISTNSSGR